MFLLSLFFTKTLSYSHKIVKNNSRRGSYEVLKFRLLCLVEQFTQIFMLRELGVHGRLHFLAPTSLEEIMIDNDSLWSY